MFYRHENPVIRIPELTFALYSDFFCNKPREEHHSCCDVTGQQASHGSREAADSCYARLRRQFPATNSYVKSGRGEFLVYISHVHQQRRQLLHLPGVEQGIQKRDENSHRTRIEENANWKLAVRYFELLYLTQI